MSIRGRYECSDSDNTPRDYLILWDGKGREGRKTRCHCPFKHQPECHRQPILEGLTRRMVGKGRHQTKDVPAGAGRGAGAGVLRTLGADADADAVASCGQPGEGTVEMEPTCMPWNPKTLESQVHTRFLAAHLPSISSQVSIEFSLARRPGGQGNLLPLGIGERKSRCSVGQSRLHWIHDAGKSKHSAVRRRSRLPILPPTSCSSYLFPRPKVSK